MCASPISTDDTSTGSITLTESLPLRNEPAQHHGTLRGVMQARVRISSGECHDGGSELAA